MKKKLILFLLVFSLLSTVSFASSGASYFSELEKIYTWDAMDSNVDMDIILSGPNGEEFTISLNTFSKSNLEDFSSYSRVAFDTGELGVELPDLEMYTKDTDLYFNSSFINYLFNDLLGMEAEEIKEDFVQIKGNENLDFNLDRSFLIEAMDFIKDMDHDIDFNMNIVDRTFSFELDNNQMIDLFSTYMLYIFENMDKLPGGLIPEEEIPSQEEIDQVLSLYYQEIEPLLGMAKEMTQGSFIRQETTFEDESYKEASELMLKLPDFSLRVLIKSNSNKIDTFDLNLPTSKLVVDEEHLNALMTDLLMSQMGLGEEYSNMELRAIMDIEGNYLKIHRDFNMEEGQLDIILENSMVFLNSEQVEVLTGLSLDIEESIWIRELEDLGFLVDWDPESMSIFLYEINLSE